ncbi:hypothetical protein HZF05_10790 [Sphingomonas sp. CGMCC 1.13654]|uniref:Uncharacterized protein n=1 Tax=Sphingomonas chungangi TaxID=2683589 RepID=A0A838L5E2_9SPHN|nr:hypothetical protein [Sphingomonas chungangi]MBA2934581.1 hypothetical protein [Sphingomonas chungangi]MVW57617.1 hypothetical protein [Sphingomonas chungangi]
MTIQAHFPLSETNPKSEGMFEDTASFRQPLTALERSVVHLALTESLTTIPHASRSAAAYEAVFGWRRPRGLADPRLEALRVFCIRLRYRGVVTAAEAGMAASQFSTLQLDQAAAIILARLKPSRCRDPMRISWSLPGLSAMAIAWAAYSSMADGLVSAILAGIVLVTVSACVPRRRR